MASLERFELYKKLKDQGFPQGGAGTWIMNPQKDEKVYIPLVEEIFTQFIADPSDWELMIDAMVNVWIEQHGNNKTKKTGTQNTRNNSGK